MVVVGNNHDEGQYDRWDMFSMVGYTHIRKLKQPETITIWETIYNKEHFEKAIKNLTPITK
jgi:hypothetical protein